MYHNVAKESRPVAEPLIMLRRRRLLNLDSSLYSSCNHLLSPSNVFGISSGAVSRTMEWTPPADTHHCANGETTS
jgi:hypothetical protein